MVYSAVLSDSVCGWVCDTYVVHHLVGTGLRCAPPSCIVHNPCGPPVDGAQSDVLSLDVSECVCVRLHERHHVWSITNNTSNSFCCILDRFLRYMAQNDSQEYFFSFVAPLPVTFLFPEDYTKCHLTALKGLISFFI